MASRAGALDSPQRSEDDDRAEQAQNVRNWPPAENQRVRVKQEGRGEWQEAVILKILEGQYDPGDGRGQTGAAERIEFLREDVNARDNQHDRECLRYDLLLMTDTSGKRPFEEPLKNIQTTRGQPWDDQARTDFGQIVKQLSEDLEDMDEEDVHALLSNEASKIDKSLIGSNEDDQILNLLEAASVDGEKLLKLTEAEFKEITDTNAAGDKPVLGTRQDMYNRAKVAIWKGVERVQQRHEDREYTEQKAASYESRWQGLERFRKDGKAISEDHSAPLPYEVIDLNLRRYGVFYFAKVVNQIGIGQTPELWQLLNFLALRMSTPVVVRLLNYFIDDFSKFDPDDKKVLELCKHIVEGAEFPIATALLMAAFMNELAIRDPQNSDKYIAKGDGDDDLEKSIGTSNFQDYFMEAASEILETVESDHLALMLLECPTNLPDPQSGLSAFDIMLRYDLHDFVGSSRIKRITGTMWTVGYDLLKPETTFRVKEVRCCDYALGLWDGCFKNGQGPRDWFNSPFGKFITEILSYVLFLVFFLYLTFERKSVYSEFDITEMLLYVFVTGFFLKEMDDMIDDWRDYFTEDTVNYLDCSIMLLFVATIGIRMDERFEWSGPTECDETCSRFCNGKSSEYPYMKFPVDPTHLFPEPEAADYFLSTKDASGDWSNTPPSIYDDWQFAKCEDADGERIEAPAGNAQRWYGTETQCTDAGGTFTGATEAGNEKNRSPVLTFYDPEASGTNADRVEMIYNGDQPGTANVAVPVYFANWGTLYAHGLTRDSVADPSFDPNSAEAQMVAVQVFNMKRYVDLFHPGFVQEGRVVRPQDFATYLDDRSDVFTPKYRPDGTVNYTADEVCETETHAYRAGQVELGTKAAANSGEGIEVNDTATLTVGDVVVDNALVAGIEFASDGTTAVKYSLTYSVAKQQQHYNQFGAVVDLNNEHPFAPEIGDCYDTSPAGLRLPCGMYTKDDGGEYDEPCPATNFFDDPDGSARFGPEPVGWFFSGSYLRYSNYHHSPRDATGNVKYGADDEDDWFGQWFDTDITPAQINAADCEAPAGANNLAIEDRGMGYAGSLHGAGACGAGAWVYKQMDCQAKIKTSRSLSYKITWSIIIILMAIRVLWFLDIFEAFGKFRKICLLMLNPLIIFMIFLIIICMGFCMAFYFVAGDTAVEAFGRFGDAAFWTMNAVQGDIDYDPIIADNSWDYGDQIRVGSYSATAAIGKGVDQLLANQAGQWGISSDVANVDDETPGVVMDFPGANYNYGIEGPPELQNVDEPRSMYLKTLMMFFLIIGAVMLLNLLVAIMATVYEEIEDDAYNQVQYQAGKNSIIKDKATGLLPAPFNIIVWAVTLVWLMFEHIFMLSSFYIDLEPWGQAFRDKQEEDKERKLQTERIRSRSSAPGSVEDTFSPKKDASTGVTAVVNVNEEPSKSDQLVYRQGEEHVPEVEELSEDSDDGRELNDPTQLLPKHYAEQELEPEKACCTCCNSFGCQIKRGPPSVNENGTVDSNFCTRMKNAYKMVWGGVDEDAWWCSYCNSFIDPRQKDAEGNPRFPESSQLLDIYYQKYEEAAAPLDGPDKLMIRKMAPKLCPACYRRRDEADRCRVLTEILSYFSFLVILWLPFSIILFPLWALYQVAKIFMASKLRKNMESDVDSKGELVMPHPKDIKDEFGTAEKYRTLFKGPYANNNVWNCAENALGIEVTWDDRSMARQGTNLRKLYGFDFNRTLHVIYVKPGSPADVAGVELGYQITDVDDEPVRFLDVLKDVENPKQNRIKNNLMDYLKRWVTSEHRKVIEIRFNNSKVAVQDDDIVSAMNREKNTGQGLTVDDIRALMLDMLKEDVLKEDKPKGAADAEDE